MGFRIDDQLNETRVHVMEYVLEAAFDGKKAALGRRLGYKDGSFIGQMLRRERPITESTFSNMLAMHEVRGLDPNRLSPAAGPGTGKSLSMVQAAKTALDSAAMKALESWRATASPKSRDVIDRLSLLAKKNRLRDEDWQLIDDMVLRLAQQPKDSKTPSLP